LTGYDLDCVESAIKYQPPISLTVFSVPPLTPTRVSWKHCLIQ